VEEARALQVPMVLSDLPVHKEQVDGNARFFDRISAPSLADALRQTWQEQSPSAPSAATVPTSITDPVNRFADDFVDLVQQVAGAHP